MESISKGTKRKNVDEVTDAISTTLELEEQIERARLEQEEENKKAWDAQLRKEAAERRRQELVAALQAKKEEEARKRQRVEETDAAEKHSLLQLGELAVRLAHAVKRDTYVGINGKL